MVLPSLTLAVARYVLGTLPSGDIPRIANDLLNRSIYADALVRLYDVKSPIMADVGPIFEVALEELSVDIPTRDHAWTILLRHHVRLILEGIVTPLDGLSDMMSELGLRPPYSGDTQGINSLLRFYWQYDCLDEPWAFRGRAAAVAKLDKELLSEASTWHRQNAGVTVSPAWLTWNDAAVRRVAETILREENLALLPVLADALEEAGCTDAEVLGHLRDRDAVHVRACWVIDLLLAKQ
jgi:hypothetical protein